DSAIACRPNGWPARAGSEEVRVLELRDRLAQFASCRLASRAGSQAGHRLGSPPDRSRPPTRSPCAAAAQVAWRPTRLLWPVPPRRPRHPPRRRPISTAVCVDTEGAWRLRAGRSAAPLRTDVLGCAAAACILDKAGAASPT